MVFQINIPELSSNSQQAITLAKSKKLGEFKHGKVIYSNYEAFFLVETKKAQLIKNSKKTTFPKKNKEFVNNYLVYKNLRKKDLIPKTGLKFGAEFRVYEKNKPHAKYLTLITTPNQKLNYKEFASKNRIAHSTAKKLLIAVIDSQQDITYYEVNWTKLK
jgi:tRNA-intron endonuclease|tara:strand:+ start:188 stop:667 length:480 start_codon:yes stop_codon:yes gene_type:complete